MRITRQILFYVEFNVASEICVNVIFIIDLSDDYDRSYLVSILFKLIRLFIHSFTYARTYSFPHSLNHSRNSPCMHDAGPQACQRRYPERNGRAPLAKILVESEQGILDLSAQKRRVQGYRQKDAACHDLRNSSRGAGRRRKTSAAYATGRQDAQHQCVCASDINRGSSVRRRRGNRNMEP